MIVNRVLNPINNLKQILYIKILQLIRKLHIFPLIKKLGLKILSQARRSSTVDGGELILEIEASNTMYTLFHVKNCINKIILLSELLHLLSTSAGKLLPTLIVLFFSKG